MDAAAPTIQRWLEGIEAPPSSPSRKRAHSPAHCCDPPVSKLSKRRRCTPPSPMSTPPSPSSSSAPPSAKRKRSSASASDADEHSSTSPRSDRYRSANLLLNGVFIAASLDASSAPQPVRDHIRTLLEAPRAPIAAERLERWVQNIIRVQDNGEEAIAVALGGSGGLLPDATYCARLRRMDRLPFANAKDLPPRVADVPAPIAANVPRVRAPVPDVTFGLSDTAFERQQLLAMTIPPTSSVCEPIPSLYWPFFVLEYKAQAKGGGVYVAVNQCAGSGSACIEAQAMLKTPADHVPLAFSCALDGRTAELLVHHLNDSTQYYVSTVHRYLLADPLHLERLHRHVHHIIEWGVSSYRDSICRMLDAQWVRATTQSDPAGDASLG